MKNFNYSNLLLLPILLGAITANATPEMSFSDSEKVPLEVQQKQRYWMATSIQVPQLGSISGFNDTNGGFMLEGFDNSTSTNLTLQLSDALKAGTRDQKLRLCNVYRSMGFDRWVNSTQKSSLKGTLNPLNYMAIKSAISKDLIFRNKFIVSRVSPVLDLKSDSYLTSERVKTFQESFKKDQSLVDNGSFDYDISDYPDLYCDLIAGNLKLSFDIRFAWPKPEAVKQAQYNQLDLQKIVERVPQNQTTFKSRDANLIAGALNLLQSVTEVLGRKVIPTVDQTSEQYLGLTDFVNLQLALSDSQTGKLKPSNTDVVATASQSLVYYQTATYVDHLIVNASVSIDGLN